MILSTYLSHKIKRASFLGKYLKSADIDIVGLKRVQSSGKRWRGAYRENGLGGLKDNRTENSGKPSERELSLEEKYARLEAQNNLLKAENELLKKIRFLERRMKREQ